MSVRGWAGVGGWLGVKQAFARRCHSLCSLSRSPPSSPLPARCAMPCHATPRHITNTLAPTPDCSAGPACSKALCWPGPSLRSPPGPSGSAAATTTAALGRIPLLSQQTRCSSPPWITWTRIGAAGRGGSGSRGGARRATPRRRGERPGRQAGVGAAGSSQAGRGQVAAGRGRGVHMCQLGAAAPGFALALATISLSRIAGAISCPGVRQQCIFCGWQCIWLSVTFKLMLTCWR